MVGMIPEGRGRPAAETLAAQVHWAPLPPRAAPPSFLPLAGSSSSSGRLPAVAAPCRGCVRHTSEEKALRCLPLPRGYQQQSTPYCSGKPFEAALNRIPGLSSVGILVG
jgi:hypothetical protein